MQKQFLKIAHHLASPIYMVWLMPALIGLLILGTVAQKYVGLYAATQTYFSSFIFFVGPVPFPGGYSLIALLSVNILFKLIFKSRWSKDQAGIIIVHLAVLSLLIGGGLTAFTQKEGFLYIPEGSANNIINDYHARELIIADDERILKQISFYDLQEGAALAFEDLPFRLEVPFTCQNCDIVEATSDDHDLNFKDGVEIIGPAQFMALKKAPVKPENEANIAGIQLTIRTVEGNEAVYQTAFFENFPKPITFQLEGRVFYLALTRAKRELPFSVYLKDFEKLDYPGTNKAREYRSFVTIREPEAGLSWDAVIAMNEPLRYKGYSLFQASFDQSGETEATVLSVVENKGWVFPYISTIIFVLGLILHLIIRARQNRHQG